MKTLKHKEAGNFKRRPDKEAHRMVDTGKWEYVLKSTWKEQVRDIDKEVHDNPLGTGFAHKDTKSNKMSKSTKRHKRKSNK